MIKESLDDLLFHQKAEALITCIAENERPLKGAASLVDWKLLGILSQFIKSGKITGEAGEIVYVPIPHHLKNSEKALHILCLGIGKVNKIGDRKNITPQMLKALSKTIKSLNLKSVCLSQKDFEDFTPSQIEKNFHDTQLWITD